MIVNFRALPYVEQVPSDFQKMNKKGDTGVKTKMPIKRIALSLIGWTAFAVAILIDGSFITELSLLGVARVLP